MLLRPGTHAAARRSLSGTLWLTLNRSEVEADAETEIIHGSGGTVEQINRGTSQARVTTTLEVRLTR